MAASQSLTTGAEEGPIHPASHPEAPPPSITPRGPSTIHHPQRPLYLTQGPLEPLSHPDAPPASISPRGPSTLHLTQGPLHPPSHPGAPPPSISPRGPSTLHLTQGPLHPPSHPGPPPPSISPRGPSTLRLTQGPPQPPSHPGATRTPDFSVAMRAIKKTVKSAIGPFISREPQPDDFHTDGDVTAPMTSL
ncbi:unnamed protein product [Arctogadus glacialis]